MTSGNHDSAIRLGLRAPGILEHGGVHLRTRLDRAGQIRLFPLDDWRGTALARARVYGIP